MPTTCEIALERPPIGQFIRQLVPVRSETLASCLREQSRTGGRLGDLLQEKGLLTREQLLEVLRFQADWVARAARADLAPQQLPLPTFLSLCLPAYNEEPNIQATLDAACATLPAFVERFEVVVVDDGSADRTGEVVGEYSKQRPCVRLVRHEQNRGYGGAVSSALRAARGDLVMFTDSDGQFSLLDLPQLLSKLEGSDVVIGYRHQRAEGRLRRINAWAWSRLVGWLLGVWVRDLDCAFKLFRREVLDRLRLTASGACISAEIMAQCVQAGLTIREVPVVHYPRHHGAPTGARLGVILRAFRELPTLWKYRSEAECVQGNDWTASSGQDRTPSLSRPASLPAAKVASSNGSNGIAEPSTPMTVSVGDGDASRSVAVEDGRPTRAKRQVPRSQSAATGGSNLLGRGGSATRERQRD